MVELIASSRFSGVVGSLSPNERYCFGTILLPSASTPRQIGHGIDAHSPPHRMFPERCWKISNSEFVATRKNRQSDRGLSQPDPISGDRAVLDEWPRETRKEDGNNSDRFVIWLITYLPEFGQGREETNNGKSFVIDRIITCISYLNSILHWKTHLKVKLNKNCYSFQECFYASKYYLLYVANRGKISYDIL